MSPRRRAYAALAAAGLLALPLVSRFRAAFSGGRGVAEPVVVVLRLDAVPEPSAISLTAEAADGREYLSPYVTACGSPGSALEPPDASAYEPVLEQFERTFSCNRLERKPAEAGRFSKLKTCLIPRPEPVFWTASMGPYTAGWLSGLRIRVDGNIKVRSAAVYVGRKKFFFTAEEFLKQWRQLPASGKNARSRLFSAPQSVRVAEADSGVINSPGMPKAALRAAREAVSAFAWAFPWFTESKADVLDRAYLARRQNLGDYLGRRLVSKAAFLNSLLTEEDRLFYFFSIERVYIKAAQLQSIMTGAPSIYRTDSAAIMRELRSENVKYLCFDYMPCFPADILSPIFEPEFFGEHFEYIETGLHKFYLFRINYDGLPPLQRNANICKIAESGFYSMFYSELKKYEGQPVKLRSNPYQVGELLGKYDAFAAKYAR